MSRLFTIRWMTESPAPSATSSVYWNGTSNTQIQWTLPSALPVATRAPWQLGRLCEQL